MFSYPMELHTKITNKIRVFDAFKNLQFISCFFDGFVIIRLKSYLQERFFIILPLFQITKEQQQKNQQKTTPTNLPPKMKQPILNPNANHKNSQKASPPPASSHKKLQNTSPNLNKKEHQTIFWKLHTNMMIYKLYKSKMLRFKCINTPMCAHISLFRACLLA